MIARAVSALLVASAGTGVFEALSRLTGGLVGSFYETLFCAVASFISTIAFARPRELGVRENLLPAMLITFSSLVAISVGHAFEQVLERRVAVDFEPFGLFIWAVVVTSWWLVPATAVVLSGCSRLVARLGLLP